MKLLRFGLFLGFFIYFLFSTHVFALETTSVYTSPNKSTSGSIIWLDLTTPKTQSLGFVQSTASYGFRFFIDKPTQIGKVYKIRLNFNDYDYLHTNTSNYWKIEGYSGTTLNGNCNLIGYELKDKGSNNQNKIVDIMYQCPTVNTGVMFYNEDLSGDNLTRISTINWRLNSIQWEIIDTNQDIINNQTQNTQNIINNQNQNSEDIINNQNEIAKQQEENQKACQNIDKNNIVIDNKYLQSDGSYGNSNNYGITSYIKIDKNSKIKVLTSLNSDSAKYCFYTSSKELISCYSISNSLVNTELTIPSNADYIRSSIQKVQNKPTFEICKNGNQAITDSVNDLNNTINDDNIGGATSDAGDFITGFDTNTFGLTSIITAPLNLIQSLTSSSCSQLELPLPYLNNKKLILPCMTTIYQSTFGSLFTMYQTITFGIIAYWVCVRIFNMVKDFKNPDHDEVEVVDL